MTEVGQDRTGTAAIQRLMAGAGAAGGRGPAPVHLWNPPFCGEIDMRISADGGWHYNGSAINRIAMVKLFATILRKDPERYVLVTPVERVGIKVDDAPFVAVAVEAEGGRLFFRTNLDEVIEAGAEHPVRFETAADGGLKPYVHVRGDLWALASRAVMMELVGLATIETLDEPAIVTAEAAANSAEPARSGDPRPMFGLRSGAAFFAIAPADETGASA